MQLQRKIAIACFIAAAAILLLYPTFVAGALALAGLVLFFKSGIIGQEKAATVDADAAEEGFHLDLTSKYLADNSGWENWDVLPQQKQLKHEECTGGPPVVYETYEYAVRGTSVFVRLIEKSKEGLDDTVYTVLGGTILQSRIEEAYREKCKPYEPGGKWEKNRDKVSRFTTPAETVATLQKETNWHEIYGALRYFVLSKDSSDWRVGRFFKEEHKRFSDAYAALEAKTAELGVTWDDKYMQYDVQGLAKEARDEVNKVITDEIFRLGFRNYGEVLDKEFILGVLKDAVGGAQ